MRLSVTGNRCRIMALMADKTGAQEHFSMKIGTRCALLLLFFGTAVNGDMPRFKAGDIVCYLGDSITQQGGYHYDIQLFYATRYPSEPIVSWNCGLAGNTAQDMLKRYRRDVMERNPTVVCIMAGMNDVSRSLYSPGRSSAQIEEKRREAIARHLDNMDTLIGGLTQQRVRVVILTPSIYDQTGRQETVCNPGVNDALNRCAAGVRKLSEKYNTSLVEFIKPMEDINLKNQATNPNFTIVGPDRIHPGEVGHLVMAWLFLKSQGISPVISEMVIDAAKKAVVKQNNCRISDLNSTAGILSFDCLENALPFPTDKRNEAALALVPFCKDLNMEELRITGLPEGEYELRIDGKKIMTIFSGQLAGGINLAQQNNTPQYRQALEVKKLLDSRSRLEKIMRTLAHVDYMFFTSLKNPSAEEKKKILEQERKKREDKTDTWSKYCLKYLITPYDELSAKEDAMKKEIDALQKQALTDNNPRLHHYELRSVKSVNKG